MRHHGLLTLSFVVVGLTTVAMGSEADFDAVVGVYLQQHCLRCHCDTMSEGEFRLDTLSKNVGVKDTALWAEVRERISSGEMPPADVPDPPTAGQSAVIVEWLSDRIKEGETQRMARREAVSFYRLSRDEYVHTVEDLLGVRFDAADPGGFSDDPEWHGFERIGSVLSLSASHVEKYFDAAETILTEAYPDKPVTPIKIRKPAQPENTIQEPHRSRLQKLGLLEKVRFDLWPQDQHRYSHPGNLPAPGIYEVRMQLSGLRPPNGPTPRLKVYHTKLDRVLHEQDVLAAEDEPTVVRFRTHLPAGSHPIVVTNDVPGPSNLPRSGRHGRKPFLSLKDGRIPWQLKLTDEEGQALYPFLILDWAEWEGPLVTDRQQRLRDDYMPAATAGSDEIRDALSKLAQRAFRRPLGDGEIDRYLSVANNELASGAEFHAAMKAAMLAILCSKDFLFLVEGLNSSEASADANRINDWELASRLSYFLWSTMPDGILFELAQAGKLRDADVLKRQVARMLADPKSQRFSNAFATQWLRLRKVGMFPPDEKLYPDYDGYLEQSMVGETLAYFRELLTHNLPIEEFLQSDWTMANARLADFYGLPDVTSDRFEKVFLRPGDHRGGLLTQAAILSLTSDGTRHRPVHRGVWVLESIFGKSPPPPPANVSAIEPSPVDAPKATLRMKLEAHQSNPSCASCHRKIDPLGLAFENFDAIGRWRTHEAVQIGTGANPIVDSSGLLPDGRSFSGAEEFKALLREDVDLFAQTFVEKLATFGLRRAITFEDRDEIEAITATVKADGYRLKSIVEAFVTSDLFQQR